jgi:hypothetical protein
MGGNSNFLIYGAECRHDPNSQMMTASKGTRTKAKGFISLGDITTRELYNFSNLVLVYKLME